MPEDVCDKLWDSHETEYSASTKIKALIIFNAVGKYYTVLVIKVENRVCIFTVVMHIHYMHGKMWEGNTPNC